MRINVYSQEMTNEVVLVCKTADTGETYYGVRLYLQSPAVLHNTAADDDRSAITFWVPKPGPEHHFSRDDLSGILRQMSVFAANCPD